MFRELREAWRQAVDNFWRELASDEAGDGSADGAYRQIGKARNYIDRLDREIGECGRLLAEELEQVEVCLRRERMALEIDDRETARIAAEYAARHRERADVLSRKLGALEAERDLCRRDLDEMEAALRTGRVAEPRSPELDDLNRHPLEHEFRDLEDGDRTRSAEDRLEELKRRMRRS